MKFSIIIPTYNVGKQINTTLESLYDQKCKDFEIIIQDACSDDGISNIVESYRQKISVPIVFHSEKDKGIYDGMNRATKLATGDYCIYLGAGDSLVDENVLNDIKEELDDETDIIYGYVIEIDSKGNKNKVLRKLDWRYKVKFTPVCHQAICASRELLIVYPFDTSYKIAADQDWLLKMVKKRKKIKYIDRPISFYPRDGFSSANSDKFVEEQKMIHSKYYPLWKAIRFTWRKIVGKD